MSVNLINSNDININQTNDDIELGFSSARQQELLDIKSDIENLQNFTSNISTCSTAEKVVGKWTDGKTLYAKTFLFTINHTTNNNTVETDIAHGIPNVDTIFVDTAHSFGVSSGNSYILGRGYVTNSVLAFLMSAIANQTNIRTEIFYKGSISFDFSITLNYTKTTD